jgi:hypothetical protein
MQYTLITKTGKVYTFYIKALADTYQQAYGGVVFTPQSLALESLKERLETPEMMAVLTRLATR